MSKKCPKCESVAVVYEDYVGGTLFHRCQTCGYRGSDFEKPTLFDRITASPEVLAETLVIPVDEGIGWYSILIRDKNDEWYIWFEHREEAIAATVAKLKEVEK